MRSLAEFLFASNFSSLAIRRYEKMIANKIMIGTEVKSEIIIIVKGHVSGEIEKEIGIIGIMGEKEIEIEKKIEIEKESVMGIIDIEYEAVGYRCKTFQWVCTHSQHLPFGLPSISAIVSNNNVLQRSL